MNTNSYSNKDIRVQTFANVYKNDNFIISSSNNKRYVSFVNTKTNEQVPDYLNRLAESFSPVHSAFLRLKTNMIIGKGVQPNMENPQVAARLEEFKAILNNIDSKGHSIDDQLKLYAANAAIHEAVVFRVVYNRLGQPRFIHYEPTSYYRCSDFEDDDGYEPQTFFIAKDWSKARPKYREYPRYDPKKPAEGIQILVSRYNTLSNPYYNVPGYHSALKSINIVSELENMYLNGTQNSFHNAGILTMVGVTTDPDELSAKEKYFQRNLTGTDNAGRTILFEVNDISQKPVYDAISKSADHQTYYELKTQANSSIVTAHGGFPELAGIDSGGVSLGGDTNKLIVSYKQFKVSITDKLQKLIVDAYNKIFKDLGFGDNAIYIEDANPLGDGVMADGITDVIDNGFDSNRTALTGKQSIQLQRIIRQYDKGKIPLERALIMLRDFGYDDDTAKELLMVEDEPIQNINPNNG